MKFQKNFAWTAAVCVLAAGLTGCGSETVTDEVIVEPKGSRTETAESAPEGTNIADLVQAPESWQTEFENGNIKVSVDAQLMLPEAQGFRLKEVTAREFERADYDAVNKTLFGGAVLMDREVREDDPAHGFTKKELEERISELEAERDSGADFAQMHGKEGSYDDAISEFKKMLEAAPEEAVMKKVDIDGFFSGGENTAEGELDYLSGTVADGNSEYYISMSKHRENWLWAIFEGQRRGSAYYPVADYGKQAGDLKTPAEDFIKKAEQAVAGIGLGDLVSAGGELFGTFEETGQTLSIGKTAYGVHFTRMVDGIGLTYTTQKSGSTENGNDLIWPDEELWLAYDDNGLAAFRWTNPYVVEDKSDEYVFLMPFSEIQNIFEELIVKKYSSFTDNGSSVEFQINNIRLGYMRVIDLENPGKGTLVPVWDFFGSQIMTPPGNAQDENFESKASDDPNYSWLTINAMDGTVIDRELGY